LDPTVGFLPPETIETIRKNRNVLEVKFEKLKMDPTSVKRNLIILVSLGLAILGIGEVIVYFIVRTGGDPSGLVYPIFLAVIPASVYWYHIMNVEKEMVELLVAERFGWLYSPDKDTDKWKLLVSVYPEIFRKGNSDQFLDNEFWGQFDNGNRNFWAGKFSYTIQSGKSSATFIESVFCF